MNILIIVSYIENVNRSFAWELADKSDYIICADGGQLIAKNFDIKPDLCIGDFDSTDSINVDNNDPSTARNYRIFDCEYMTYPAEKSITDGEAAINQAVKRFNDTQLNISVLGGIGGRLDHTIGAINTVRKYLNKQVSIRLKDMKNSAEFISSEINNSISIEASGYYKFFSVIPYTDEACGVTIRGAKYNLNNYNMKKLETLGISNEIKNKDGIATISVRDGDLLVIRSSD